MEEMTSVRGLSKRSYSCIYVLTSVFKGVLEKTMENSEQLGRQVPLGIEPGTFLLPI